MSSKIRVLSEHTINKIAAGEVIENPASVVKELVENSLDAGATDICVEIREGGRQLIRITDNGSGMNSDDALLCLERHATSKIKEVEDIQDLFTMGFRGEAIPSIAAISKFTLLTCPQDAEMGTLVIVDGGKLISCTPAAHSKGTTIEIKSLFFNVPVRKKFQKSPAYDTNEILKMLGLLALGNPTIKFELISHQENLLTTPLFSVDSSFEDALKERIIATLGIDYFESLTPIDEKNGNFHLQGFIGLPSVTRPNRMGQYLFINQRGISSPLISFAIRDGYGTTLPTNRHPIFVLHLTLPGSLVDVNVHPQKREVRLRQEQDLKAMVIRGVEKALQNTNTSLISPTETFQNNFTPFFNKPNFHSTPFYSSEAFSSSFVSEPKSSYESFALPQMRPASTPNKETNDFFQQPLTIIKPIPKILATIKRYILIENTQDGFSLVDQKAAHSRIIFEKLLKQEEGKEAATVQTLLIPYTLQVTPSEATLVNGYLNFLNQLGIHIHASGPDTFLIDALPEFFGNTDIQTFISELLHTQNTNLLNKEKEKQIALAAGRASVSKDRKLSLEEAQSLIQQLMQSESPYHCPQGKPTIIEISQDDLMRYFTKGN